MAMNRTPFITESIQRAIVLSRQTNRRQRRTFTRRKSISYQNLSFDARNQAGISENFFFFKSSSSTISLSWILSTQFYFSCSYETNVYFVSHIPSVPI